MIKTQKPKLQEGGFTAIKFVIVVVILGMVGVVGFFVYLIQNKLSLPINSDSSVKEECNLIDGINFCIQPSSTSVSPSDSLTIKASLKNQTDKTYSTAAIYSSSCNEPSVSINNRDVMDFKMCTQDITSVRIGAGRTKTYDIDIDTNNLRQGANTIILKWNGDKLVSKPIAIELKAKTKADEAKSISCIGEQTAQPYCASVVITFKQGTFKEEIGTCDDLENYVKPLGLRAERESCSLAGIGIISVYVPKDDADYWMAKIKQLPQVESVVIR